MVPKKSQFSPKVPIFAFVELFWGRSQIPNPVLKRLLLCLSNLSFLPGLLRLHPGWEVNTRTNEIFWSMCDMYACIICDVHFWTSCFHYWRHGFSGLNYLHCISFLSKLFRSLEVSNGPKEVLKWSPKSPTFTILCPKHMKWGISCGRTIQEASWHNRSDLFNFIAKGI